MQIKVTDTITGVTILRDVERIDMRFPNTSSHKVEVYFQECVCVGTKMFGKPTWVNDPLVLDITNPKIIHAIEFLKTVILQEEEKRIIATHNITPIKTNGK